MLESEPLPTFNRDHKSSQRVSAVERAHCQAILQATERVILGEGTPEDLILVNQNRARFSLEPL